MKTLEYQVITVLTSLETIHHGIEHKIRDFPVLMNKTRRVAKRDLDNIRRQIHRYFSHVSPAANGRDEIIAEVELFIREKHKIAKIAINDGGEKLFDYLFVLNFSIVKGEHHDDDYSD